MKEKIMQIDAGRCLISVHRPADIIAHNSDMKPGPAEDHRVYVSDKACRVVQVGRGTREACIRTAEKLAKYPRQTMQYAGF